MNQEKNSEITNQVFKFLVENREKLLLKVKEVSDAKGLIVHIMIMMNKAECYQYIELMGKRRYKIHFQEIMNFQPDISQSAYVKRLEGVYKNLMEIIAEEEQNPDLATQLSSIFIKLAEGSNVERVGIQKSRLKIPDKIDVNPSIIKPNQVPQPNPEKSFIKVESSKIFGSEMKPEPKKDKISKIKQEKPENSHMRKPESQNEPHFQPDVKNFKTNELNVVVRYFAQTFDYGYGYGNRNIKDQMSVRIRNFLEKNSVSFKRVSNSITIMEDVSIVKSQDAGNYYFDPFCQSVEIKIERKDKKQFTNDFKIEGDLKNVQISEEKVQRIDQWNKAFLKLTAKDDIKSLVDYIGQKRQESTQDRNSLIQGLRKKGGANTIQDLFNWSTSSYQRLGVKPTWMYEIQQTIEIIKDNSKLGSEKSFSQKKRDCLKIANSHKILRYLVYKNYDMKEVLKLPWLNMKNVKQSIEIVRNQIHNTQLLNQLEKYFDQFALDPKDDPIPYSRGLVLYGPPGTGKTVLTEAMPNIMGFHLISKGLSAADFMKSLVGQSSRMIRDLVNRANQCPYLLCSVGIDEVDGLVPDRKDKDEKNKGQGISMLLSVIGGNKDVPNLVFMTSTNYLKKIDEAIRRRLSGQYQVGRPNPEQRKKIILQQVSYLKNHSQLLNHLILITTNFTGASLKGISNQLNKNLRTKQMQGKPISLVEDEVTDAAILMARQFSITLGVYTLPEIYKSQTNKKNFFTKKFLSRVTDNLLVVQQYVDHMSAKNKFILMYANRVSRYVGGKFENLVEKEEQKFFLEVREGNQFEDFENYLKTFTKSKMATIRSKNCRNNSAYRRNLKQILDYIPARSKETTLVLIQDFVQSEDQNVRTANVLLDSRKNIYTIFYMTPYSASSNFFSQLYGKSVQHQAKLNYTGRIFVQLNDQARMAFELNRSVEEQSKVAFKLFLKSEQSNSPKNVIPQLVNFFTKQQVSYILLLDYELLLQNDAFQEKKMLEIMEEKMTEAKNYDRVAVIINVDSLITMSQNASDSNFGRSMSYSVVNHNMYQILLNYMSEFAMVNDSVNKWVSIVIKNEQLVKKVKKDLNWPLYPEEEKKQKEQQDKDKEKLCVRCGLWFTDRKNKEERTCMQHPGKIVDMRNGQFEDQQPDILRANLIKIKAKNKGKEGNKQKQQLNEDRYMYTCCQKNISEDGHKPYYHIPENFLNTQDDDLYMDRLRNDAKWDEIKGKMAAR